jgi:hypothetical protein
MLDWNNPDKITTETSIIVKDDFIYKHGCSKYIDREYTCLNMLKYSGYVPKVKRLDKNTLEIEKINQTLITNEEEWFNHYEKVLLVLNDSNIIHGDLTMYNIIPNNNKPYIIDFSEAIFNTENKNPKRPEPDSILLFRNMIYHFENKKYPVFYNSRVPEIWYHIKKTLSKNNKLTFIDLGCGMGDLSIRTMIDYNYTGILVEKELMLINDIIKKTQNLSLPYIMENMDILNFIKQNKKANIMYCCSVLPYFTKEEQQSILKYMCNNSDVSYIEIQYYLDGPGTIKNDDECKTVLHQSGFNSIEDIGSTYIDYRNMYRKIWKCTK